MAMAGSEHRLAVLAEYHVFQNCYLKDVLELLEKRGIAYSCIESYMARMDGDPEIALGRSLESTPLTHIKMKDDRRSVHDLVRNSTQILWVFSKGFVERADPKLDRLTNQFLSTKFTSFVNQFDPVYAPIIIFWDTEFDDCFKYCSISASSCKARYGKSDLTSKKLADRICQNLGVTGIWVFTITHAVNFYFFQFRGQILLCKKFHMCYKPN